jgi:hypothetical protein
LLIEIFSAMKVLGQMTQNAGQRAILFIQLAWRYEKTTAGMPFDEEF